MSDDPLADALSQLSGESKSSGSTPPARPAAPTPSSDSPAAARPATPASSKPTPASPTPVARSRPATPRPASDEEELVAAEMDDEADDSDDTSATAAADPMASLRSAAQPRAATMHARKHQDGIKGVAAPILLTVGLLLLIPAMWGTLLLAGMQVPLTDRPNAQGMAKFMALAGWPTGAILVVAGLVCLVQVLNARKRR